MERRAQLVLLAAAIVAVALVPLLFASLQLGYSGDVESASKYDRPVENAERMLARAIHESATDGERRTWENRSERVTATRSELDPRLETLESSRVERGTVYRVEYNETAANEWQDVKCPSGPDRQFGPCSADRGVIVQERVGETHVLGVALDVVTIADDRTVETTVVVRTVGGTRSNGD